MWLTNITVQAVSGAKNGGVQATLSAPFRPHLFGKAKPVVLNLSRAALARDEVFLILVFIYGETKRQEKMVCQMFSPLAQALGLMTD